MEKIHAQSLLGGSPAILRVMQLIARVAPTEATVLITGESGTGKEVAARALHERSARCNAPFVAINCGALPASLIESELFGHEKGSFTGAYVTQRGLVERADGGTLFLDEITEMPIELQVRLLRYLETRRYFRVGGREEQASDLRVIAATNRLPQQAVSAGLLREDLLYRLAVFPLELPALRERGDDVALLAQHFLEELNERLGTRKRLGEAGLATLRRHPWPGNVRELRNAVERAHILGDELLDLEPMPQSAPSPGAHDRTVQIRIGATLEDAERLVIEATLGHHGGNKRRAAATLGCSVKTLYNKLASYDREDGMVPA